MVIPDEFFFKGTLYNGTYILKERKSTWEPSRKPIHLGQCGSNLKGTLMKLCDDAMLETFARVRPHCSLLRVSSLLANRVRFSFANIPWCHVIICEELSGFWAMKIDTKLASRIGFPELRRRKVRHAILTTSALTDKQCFPCKTFSQKTVRALQRHVKSMMP